MVLEELRTQAPPAPAGRMLEAALRQTARITRLAEGLLDVQRIDNVGELRLDRQPHNASALVNEVLSYVRLDHDVKVDVGERLTIHVDKQRFEQILVNLITNAGRYGRPPIVVRVYSEGQFDRLEVRDHGPGIPDSLRSRLFSQFAVGSAEGVGLGLWIVRQLAVAHGGRAVAEARAPGVAMVITFPRPVVIDGDD